ncbi:MAG: hypothetical protein JO002_01350, partial [Burkholderiaceae bacterium]|nr:hypothetical protein [Burkholderiaceae bacterium]
VPAAQWRAIGNFLAGVRATDTASSADITSQLPDYATLRSCAEKWSVVTHPNLLGLARNVSQYGAYFANDLGPRLRSTAEMAPADGSKNTALDVLLQPAVDTAQRCATLAAALVPDLQRLSSASLAVQNALPGVISSLMAQSVGIPGMSDGSDLAQRLADQVNAIAANLAQVAVLYSVTGNVPLHDIERLRGAWGGISDDLALLKTDMQNPISGEDPIIADLDLQSEISQWQNVAAEAVAFAAAA